MLLACARADPRRRRRRRPPARPWRGGAATRARAGCDRGRGSARSSAGRPGPGRSASILPAWRASRRKASCTMSSAASRSSTNSRASRTSERPSVWNSRTTSSSASMLIVLALQPRGRDREQERRRRIERTNGDGNEMHAAQPIRARPPPDRSRPPTHTSLPPPARARDRMAGGRTHRRPGRGGAPTRCVAGVVSRPMWRQTNANPGRVTCLTALPGCTDIVHAARCHPCAAVRRLFWV